MQVLLRVRFFLRGVSPRRAFPWGSTPRTHLCLRFKLKLKGSRRPPRSHLRRLSLPSLSQTLRLISALLGFRISSSLKSSLSLKFNSRNRILRLRFTICPFHPLKPKHAQLRFRLHPLGLLLLLQRRQRLIWGKRLRMCISMVCPLISRKISYSRSPVPLVRSVVCGRSPGMSGIARVDMDSFCTSFFLPFPSFG